MAYEIQRKGILPATSPVGIFPSNSINHREMMQKEPATIDALARVFPKNFPLAVLRDEGSRSTKVAHEVELEGEIYAVVPGSNQAYRATRAVVSWITPMDVEVLGIEDKQKDNGVALRLGKLEFKGHKEPPKRMPIYDSAGYDPNIVLQTARGDIRINQALGVPEFYVKDCKVLYKL